MTVAFQCTSSVASIQYDFNFQCFSALASAHPGIDFLMLVDKDIDPCFVTEKNIKTIAITPKPVNFLKKKWLQGYVIPNILKKNKVDLFFSGNHWSPVKSSCRKIIRIDNENIFNSKNNLSLISAADHIIVVNEHIKSLLEKHQPDNRRGIVIPGIIHENVVPLNSTQREEVKKEFSNEKDYFLLFAEKNTSDMIIQSLKAFSQFKKWQKSSMKLLVAMSKNQAAEINSLLSSYKFREDVIVLADKPEGIINALIASAYCLIFTDTEHHNRQMILHGMKSEVPVILPDNNSEHSSFENAALFGTNSENSLSKNMMLIYKDEETRSVIISKAKNLAAQLFPHKIAGIIKDRIIDATP